MIDYVMIKNRFFWIVSAALVLGILFTIGHREQNLKISPSFRTSSMKELHLINKNGNSTEWELFADNAIFPLDGREITLQSIDLKINYSDIVYMTGGSATYLIDEGNMSLNDSVQVRMGSTKFITDNMKWYSEDEFITTDDPIRIDDKQFTIEGNGMTVQLKKKKARIEKNVKAVFFR